MENEGLAEVREWLVKIDTNQIHITKLLESIQEQSAQALDIGKTANDKADRALLKAKSNREDLEEYKVIQAKERKWFVGVMISVIGLTLTAIMFLTPILINYYIE